MSKFRMCVKCWFTLGMGVLHIACTMVGDGKSCICSLGITVVIHFIKHAIGKTRWVIHVTISRLGKGFISKHLSCTVCVLMSPMHIILSPRYHIIPTSNKIPRLSVYHSLAELGSTDLS